MKRIYISGKITGLDIEEARANFQAAEETVRQLGFEPVNPMNLVFPNDTWTWSDYMKADIAILMTCDGLYMQKNWTDSAGAVIEHNLAEDLDYTIIYENATINNIKSWQT